MSKQAFDEAIRRQALSQNLNDVLAATLNDRNVSLFGNLPSNFAYSSSAGGFEAPFLSLRHLPSFPLGVSGLNPFPSPRPANYFNPPAAWKNSDDFLLAAVEAERRRVGEVRDALIRKHQMATHEAQEKHAFLRQQQQQQQQQQQRDSYLTFLQSAQPMQTMAPSTATTYTVYIGNKFCKTETPADSTKVFKELGSSLRGKKDPYIDVSELPIIAGQERQTIRGGVAEPFPQKLYFMLQDVEKEGKSNIVSFYSHGRAFAIHDMEAFADEILPKYFASQIKLVSFVRQLNLYGFARIHSGPDISGHYHELFLKGRPELLAYMRRTGASKGKEDRRKSKDRHTLGIQPDFYAMKPIRPGQPSPAP
jgi:hypothetical protein